MTLTEILLLCLVIEGFFGLWLKAWQLSSQLFGLQK